MCIHAIIYRIVIRSIEFFENIFISAIKGFWVLNFLFSVLYKYICHRCLSNCFTHNLSNCKKKKKKDIEKLFIDFSQFRSVLFIKLEIAFCLIIRFLDIVISISIFVFQFFSTIMNKKFVSHIQVSQFWFHDKKKYITSSKNY